MQARSHERGFDLIRGPHSVGPGTTRYANDAIEYPKFSSASQDTVIRVYDVASNVTRRKRSLVLALLLC